MDGSIGQDMNEGLLQFILLTHLASTLYMTGLIWFVQIVHYPLFAAVDPKHFTVYEQQHTRRTTWVVAPPMLIELITGTLLLIFRPESIPTWQPVVGLLLLAVIWLSTAFIQVPCHNKLTSGFDRQTHHRLVNTNWIRTIAWSTRLLLVGSMA